CPGDMMATNPRWCQPVAKWRDYFRGWIHRPDPEAQMLASVMFDLRPIGGAAGLFTDIQTETLEAASKNSIFVAHMVSNSLKHTPPLGLIRGFATIRSGEHRNQIALKHSGVVPVADLGRVYALQGRLTAVNTRARLAAATEAGVISPTGGRDLMEAYDLIAETRLEHQARRVRAGGGPDNFPAPSDPSDFERSHLRDAFADRCPADGRGRMPGGRLRRPRHRPGAEGREQPGRHSLHRDHRAAVGACRLRGRDDAGQPGPAGCAGDHPPPLARGGRRGVRRGAGAHPAHPARRAAGGLRH